MRCGDCDHFHRESDVELLGSASPKPDTIGRCRRWPPQVGVFLKKDDNEVVPMVAWPQLHEGENGCGEFSPAPVAIAISDDARDAMTEARVCSDCDKVNAGQLVEGEERCSCRDQVGCGCTMLSVCEPCRKRRYEGEADQ